ncbi:hypothetical protein [Oligoflexus sp.]|nr:hypothetical protein [Oligoflexus sp.]
MKNFLENFGGTIDLRFGEKRDGFVRTDFVIRLPPKLYEVKHSKI